MMILHKMPKMDMSNKTPILVLVIISLNSVSGLHVPRPKKMVANILDGEVIVHWELPVDAPSNPKYNVEMAKYTGEWERVTSCTGITNTYCNLSSLIHDYRSTYKVRVQLVTGDDKPSGKWKDMKFHLTESELLPPSFTLSATSSTLSVSVHQKPVLKEIFPFGVTYTIYLEDRSRNKTTTAYLNNDPWEDKRVKKFTSLQSLKEYCVSMKIQGNGAVHTSSVSHQQCLQLPQPESLIILVSSLSVLGVLVVIAIIASILLCYLTQPVKPPAALKCPVSGWHPLSVGEGTIEVVTDKGWFLSSYKTEIKNCVKELEDSGEEDRRTSMDSGISTQSKSATNNEGSPPKRQEDSGCGSLGGSEGSTSGQTDYPVQDEKTATDTVQKKEDSGVGLGCQLDSLSIHLDGQESRTLNGSVAGNNYRNQSPSAFHVHVCDDVDNTVLAEVVTGYRAGPPLCICSGAGQCTWCHKQGPNGPQVFKQYKSICIESALLNNNCDFVDCAGLTFTGYSKETCIGENFPLLQSLSHLTRVEGEQDFNMNDVSLSLCDIQLEND